MHCDGMKFAIASLNPYYIHIVWKFPFKTASSKIKKLLKLRYHNSEQNSFGMLVITLKQFFNGW
jgi:hypothetical protein